MFLNHILKINNTNKGTKKKQRTEEHSTWRELELISRKNNLQFFGSQQDWIRGKLRLFDNLDILKSN